MAYTGEGSNATNVDWIPRYASPNLMAIFFLDFGTGNQVAELPAVIRRYSGLTVILSE